MRNSRNTSFSNCVTVILFAAVLFWGGVSKAVEIVNCGFDPVSFDGFQGDQYLGFWDITDDAGNGRVWGDLSQCGMTNMTGGTGDAICVRATPSGPAFDTSLVTNTFSLIGATFASVGFRINYNDLYSSVSGDDRLYLEISDTDGSTWTTMGFYTSDLGGPGGAGVGISIPPAFLGSGELKLRFRYTDTSAGLDSGGHVQIDNLVINCFGGADIQVTSSVDKTTVVEGEEVNFSFTYLNGGPVTTSGMIAVAVLPPGFVRIEPPQVSSGVAILDRPRVFGSEIGALSSGSIATITTRVRAVTAPEVSLQVSSPAPLAGEFAAKGATFGPRIDPDSPISGMVVLAEDGNGDPNDGCDPLTNGATVSGKIVYLANTGGCSRDESIKNAQDAGAIAAITTSAALPFPAPLGPLGILIGGGYDVMTPSGNVADPITIPSIMVDSSLGITLQGAIASGLSVTFQGVQVLAQENDGFAFGFSDVFDPDFSSVETLYFLMFGHLSNNYQASPVTVLRDTDSDGTADLDDECPKDSAKIAAGDCGCGAVDVDTDGNSISDCLSSAELKDLLKRAKRLIKQLRQFSETGNARKDRLFKQRQRKVKKELRSVLKAIVGLVQAPAQTILLVNSNTSLEKLAKGAKRKGKKAMKTASSEFQTNKKRAQRAVNKLSKALA